MRVFALSAVASLAVVSSLGCGSMAPSSPEDQAAADEEALTASKLAGAYQHLGTHEKGEIYQLLLRPNKTFFMWLKGEYGCDVFAGFGCPSSWSSGRSGDTLVTGSWKATSKGVELQPKGEGKPSAPIPMTVTTDENTATIEGTIVPSRRIFGKLDVVALSSKKHTATENDLYGTWQVVGPTTADGDQARITGTNMYVGTEYAHTIEFRKETKVFQELRSDDRARAKGDGSFFVAGSPDGKGPGVLILDQGFMFDPVPIVSISSAKVTFDVNPDEGHRKLNAVKK